MAQRCWSAPDPLPPVYLCLAAPLRHCPFDSLLHSPTEPSFCSFCEQKQRISGAVAHCSTWNTVHFVNRSSESVAHCSTWNTVHFVNRSSEAMEQRPSVSRSIPPCMRVWIGALRPTPHHTTTLNHCAIPTLCRGHTGTTAHHSAYLPRYQAIPTLCRGHTGTTAHHSAYLPRYQAIAPLCLCFRPIVLRLRSAASDRFEHPEAEGAQNVQNWNSARKQ